MLSLTYYISNQISSRQYLIFFTLGILLSLKLTKTKELRVNQITHNNQKILFLTDIHLDILYDSSNFHQNLKYYNHCKNTKNYLKHTYETFDYGRYDCNTPENLLRITLVKIAKDGIPDLVLLGGDLVAHKLSTLHIKKVGYTINKSLFHQTIEKIKSIIREYLPKTVPILFTVGNNDFLEHYNMPTGKSREEQFAFLERVFFEGEGIDLTLKNYNSDLNATLIEGMFYSYDFVQIWLFILNSNLFSLNNKSNSKDTAMKQMRWLEEGLKILDDQIKSGIGKNGGTSKKAIIVMHLPPYPHYFNGKITSHWKDEFLNKFDYLCLLYKNTIASVISGHLHWSKISVRDTDTNLNNLVLTLNNSPRLKNKVNKTYLGTLSLPGITPSFNNNPGYSLIYINKNKVVNIIAHFADLKKTLDKDTRNKYSLNEKIKADFLFSIKYDFQKEFHFKEINNEEISKFLFSSLNKKKMLYKYLSYTCGFSSNEKNISEVKRLYTKKKINAVLTSYDKFICCHKILTLNEMRMCKRKYNLHLLN